MISPVDLTAPPTIQAAAQQLRSGATTSVALVQRCFERADHLDAQLGTYLARFDEPALRAAQVADEELARGRDRGPLHGIPIGVKDVIAAKEGPTTGQSVTLPHDWWSGEDATVVGRLRAAGAVITGKTTTLEFASGFPDLHGTAPIPRNPWNLNAWAGGSSSGSANGLAVGMFAGALGTDTGASIRMPAAFCGVTGLLPTYGLVPTSKLLYLAPSLDRIGPLAHTALDCRTMLRALCTPQPGESPADRMPAQAHDGLGRGLRGGGHHRRAGRDRVLRGRLARTGGNGCHALRTARCRAGPVGADLRRRPGPLHRPAGAWCRMTSTLE
jgi:aspartyl-tRNA(Asn)/glutamyl-tRNA(Gln) amidotransferase subunit A